MNNNEINKLAQTLKPLYQNMLEMVGEENNESNIKFCIQWGESFPMVQNDGIMFYGRANNGWMCHDTNVDDIFDLNNPDRAYAREDQMIWVEESAGATDGYNTNNSAFWRVIRKVAREFYPDNELQHIVWSNLCKIAPEEANPSDALYYSQLPAAAEIMRAEIEFFSPKHIVLLTREDWAMPFLRMIFGKEDLDVVATATFGGENLYEIKVYENNGIRYYLSEHPQGKNERTHIEALVKLMKE